MKSLQIIQTLSKIGKVLSKIVFVFSIIGAVGCTVGMASLTFGDSGVLKIGGVTIHGLIENKAGVDVNSLYPMMAGAMIVCIGEAVLARFAEKYFAHELASGTPFTVDGANEMLRLGVLTICVPLGALILAQIVSSVMVEVNGCGEAFGIDNGGSAALGIMFIVMSVLCRYGAELQTQN